MCSECNQVVRLSTNMISSRDTKVRMLLNHPLHIFFFHFYFPFCWPHELAATPDRCYLPCNILKKSMLQLPSVCLCRKTHFQHKYPQHAHYRSLAGDCLWNLACSLPAPPKRPERLRLRLTGEDAFAKTPAAKPWSPGEFSLYLFFFEWTLLFHI